MGLIILPTQNLPVTSEELAGHLRMGEAEATEDAATLQRLIQTTTHFIEAKTRATICTRSFKQTMTTWPIGPIIIQRPPLQEVTAIKYIDAQGESQTVPPDTYRVDAAIQPGRVTLKPGQSWPTTSDITVEFIAGTDQAPPMLKQAVLMLAGHWYANREATSDRRVNEVPFALQTIIDMHSFPEAA